jgi:hypothetical protein
LHVETYKDHSYYGGPSDECPHCGVVFWFQEWVKSVSAVAQRRLVYNLCCRGGKIVLEPYKCPPPPLCDLLRFDGDNRARRFLRQIRSYNSESRLEGGCRRGNSPAGWRSAPALNPKMRKGLKHFACLAKRSPNT